MRPVVVLLLLGSLVSLSGVVLADELDWRSWLQADRIVIEDERMRYEEFSACRLQEGAGEPTLLQIHWTSEASVGLLSRDAFAMQTASMNTAIFHDMLRDARERFPSIGTPLVCGTRRALIGDPDLRVELIFAEGGLQSRITITETGQVTRHTVEWQDMFR